MEMSVAIDELVEKGVFISEIKTWHFLSGGTSSQVAKVCCEGDWEYVVKINDSRVIRAEARFLCIYGGLSILPSPVYEADEYVVYPFLEGETSGMRPEKRQMLQELVVGLINHYRMATRGSGWYSDVHWFRFLQKETMGARSIIGNRLSEEDALLIVRIVQKQPIEPAMLLHGDCGVHNFLFQNMHLSAVIDPIPVDGPPTYDLIFAFFSSPEDLTEETLTYALQFLKTPIPEDFYGSVLIGLYIRIARCLLHHPADLEKYLEAWEYWKLCYYRQKNSTLRDSSVE